MIGSVFNSAFPKAQRLVARIARGVFVCVLGGFAFGTGVAHAARLAFVVGNDNYVNAPKLQNARNDAAAMDAALRSAGFTVKRITDASRDQLLKAKDEFVRTVGKDDEVVFFFAGHGSQPERAGPYLLPVDISPTGERQITRDGLSLEEVVEDLRIARVAVIIIDACRDDPFKALSGRRSVLTGSQLIMKDPPKGVAVLMAASTGQQALDRVPGASANNGLFTHEFLRHMKTPGLKLSDMLRRVRESVEATAQRHGKEQRPSLRDELSGEFYFFPETNAGAQPPPSTDTDQLACDAARGNGGKLAWRAYLNEFPNGRCAAAARVALAEPEPRPGLAPESSRPSSPAVGSTLKDCDVCPELVVLPRGSFTMGSPSGESGRYVVEGPQQRITIDRTLAVGKFEVTQGEWQAVMGSNPSHFKDCGPRCPVENVSWNDAKEYINKLNKRTGNRYGYRLLSEAEWEYATRAGCTTAFSIGGQCKDQISTREANFDGNHTYNGSAKGEYRQKTIVVGSLNAANAWGLHDMHGNVMEWVEDCWVASLNGIPGNGSARTSNCSDTTSRVLRGGSWYDVPQLLRAAYRDRNTSDARIIYIGFRVARTVNF